MTRICTRCRSTAMKKGFPSAPVSSYMDPCEERYDLLKLTYSFPGYCTFQGMSFPATLVNIWSTHQSCQSPVSRLHFNFPRANIFTFKTLFTRLVKKQNRYECRALTHAPLYTGVHPDKHRRVRGALITSGIHIFEQLY